MSAHEAIYHFGSIWSEYLPSAPVPNVGDKLKRGGAEWVVTTVGRDADGNVVVTLTASDQRDRPNRVLSGEARAGHAS